MSMLPVLRVALLLAALACVQGLPAGAAPAPEPIAATAAAVMITDSERKAVMLAVPTSLHRPANAFRLYGNRPLTLRSHDRRRDLYRDLFLELATLPQAGPPTTAWDSLGEQVQWLARRGICVRLPGVDVRLGPPNPEEIKLDGDLLLRLPGAESARDLVRQVTEHPAYRHATGMAKALGWGVPSVQVDEPVFRALQLRALATDAAELRLLRLGTLLGLDRPPLPGSDRALREGYAAARGEFEELQKGLWPAVAQAVKRDQGRLALSAVRRLALSNLGIWAIFGRLGWQGLESAVNVEYEAQLAVCAATVGRMLQPAAVPDDELALAVELVAAHHLVEAHRSIALLAIQPAGGRGAEDWRSDYAHRRQESARRLTTPGPAPEAPRTPDTAM